MYNTHSSKGPRQLADMVRSFTQEHGVNVSASQQHLLVEACQRTMTRVDKVAILLLEYGVPLENLIPELTHGTVTGRVWPAVREWVKCSGEAVLTTAPDLASVG